MAKDLVKNKTRLIQEGILTALILATTFLVSTLFQHLFDTRTLIPMVFVLGVFFISLLTKGYFWGIMASLVSVLLVNYAFMAPYYAIDLISPYCVFSAVVMLVVAIMTGALTTKIKLQEKMKSESEMERMRANLLRAVSHDLRTPLTSIYGSCSAIIENYDSLSKEHQLKLLGEIREDSEWLIRMVENLLSVTRIDGGRVEVAKMPTVLEELIDAVIVKFRKNCPEQEVRVDIPEEFISIPMDAMLIEQVLVNILENAVDHAVGMTELVLKVDIKNDKAVFNIMDNGCGISPERMNNLFKGYFEGADVLTDGSRRNMGIGLSVCHTIVKAHGSEMYAFNRPEGGALFGFELPIQ